MGLRGTRLQRSGENYIKRSLMICIPHPIFWGDYIEKNEMGGALARMGERRGVYRVLVGKPEGKNHLEDPGVDGRIIRWISRKWGYGGMDWIELAQDRDM